MSSEYITAVPAWESIAIVRHRPAKPKPAERYCLGCSAKLSAFNPSHNWCWPCERGMEDAHILPNRTHGTNASYKAGCRCQPCTNSAAKAQRDRTARKLAFERRLADLRGEV